VVPVVGIPLYLYTHFTLGRLHGRHIVTDRQTPIQHLQQSLAEYAYAVDFHDHHNIRGIFESEVCASCSLSLSRFSLF
jgi:hypothetical protein